jgi:GT2 family glycosyltransferase
MTPSIDVVIPVRDKFALTDRCLRHLQVQTLPHCVIIVDNGSIDGTADKLADLWPAVCVERFDHALSFARACNHGVAAGSGEYIVLLNNDVDCRPDFLERLAAPLIADPAVGAVAALMLKPGEETIDSVGLCADSTLAAFQRLHGLSAARATDTRPVVACPAGAAAGYRRTAWSAAGGLDEAMPAYMEDFELGLRLRAAGWNVATAPDAVGVHLGSATYGHRTADQRRRYGFGRGYVLGRYGVLSGTHAVRTVATEALVVVADALISRDAAALSGRLAGWRCGRGATTGLAVPDGVIDGDIGFRRSLELRRGVYTGPRERKP